MQKKMNRSASSDAVRSPVLDVSGEHVHSPEIDGEILSSFKNCYVYKTFLAADSVEIAVIAASSSITARYQALSMNRSVCDCLPGQRALRLMSR